MQNTGYEMRISDWSSDVCSSDLAPFHFAPPGAPHRLRGPLRSFSPPTPASGEPWGFWAVLEAPMVFTFQPPFSAGLSGYCAEMGSAFLCAALGIEPTVRHADYLASWLDVLREDNRAIFRAAGQASRAADWLLARYADAEAIGEGRAAA